VRSATIARRAVVLPPRMALDGAPAYFVHARTLLDGANAGRLKQGLVDGKDDAGHGATLRQNGTRGPGSTGYV